MEVDLVSKSYFMNNSYYANENEGSNSARPMCNGVQSYNFKTTESDITKSSRKQSEGDLDELKSLDSDSNFAIINSKLNQFINLLEGVRDDSELLITGKPKNRSYKIRKSNRYSRFRGVSMNGKKWQVMIMGPSKKKYFGAISCERDAAILYDKLSILTNGLAAKTNFNYRKSDLVKMLPELEMMQPYVCN